MSKINEELSGRAEIDTRDKIKAVGILVSLRNILRGKNEVAIRKFLKLNKENTIEFRWSMEFVENDIVVLQNLDEGKIQQILRDAENMLKKYCPQDWRQFVTTYRKTKNEQGEK